MDDELQGERADVMACPTRARGAGGDVAEPPVECDERHLERLERPWLDHVREEEERIALDLGDAELVLHAERDLLQKLGEDLPRVLELGPGDELGVPRDVRQDDPAVPCRRR